MPRSQRAVTGSACFAVLALTGCAAGGQDWVHRAADPTSQLSPQASERALPEEGEAPVASWPRREVITLGERTEVPEEAPANPADSGSAPSVSYVTNNYYPNSGYGLGYGYGYGFGYGIWPGAGQGPDRPDQRPDPHPGSPPATPRMGGNWTAPPSYGPPMMTQTAPANPWR